MRFRANLATSAWLLTLMLVGACQLGPRPEATVRRFLQSLNDKDVNLMLTCVDPRQERMLRAAFRIVESLTGFPLQDLFELFPGLNQIFGQRNPEDFRFSNIRVTDRSVEGELAQVTVSLTSHIRSQGVEQTRQEKVRFRLQKFEGFGWRIIEIQPA
jgi:hypothetical protein